MGPFQDKELPRLPNRWVAGSARDRNGTEQNERYENKVSMIFGTECWGRSEADQKKKTPLKT